MGSIKKSAKGYFKGLDKILLILSVFASSYGALLVYSATKSTIKSGQLISSDLRSAIIALVLGIIAALIISSIDYNFISNLWLFIGAFCIIIMIATYFFGVAPADRPDAKSWLKFGSFTFQSSELVKIGFIITFSVHLNKVKENINSIPTLLLLFVHACIPIGLVLLTGDAGSALVFAVIFIAMLFAAGLHYLYFVAGIALVGIAFPIAWATGLIKGYQRDRFLAVIHPEKYAKTIAFQQNASVTAVGSGQVTGKGFLNGPFTQNGSIPESQNDMILAVSGEEFGFLGTMTVLIILLAIVLRILYIGVRSGDPVGYLICTGMVSMIVGQAFINIGMCLRILPVIGITLPFFSAGGSSNLCIYLGIGLVLNIYRGCKPKYPKSYRLQY